MYFFCFKLKFTTKLSQKKNALTYLTPDKHCFHQLKKNAELQLKDSVCIQNEKKISKLSFAFGYV